MLHDVARCFVELVGRVGESQSVMCESMLEVRRQRESMESKSIYSILKVSEESSVDRLMLFDTFKVT